MVKVTGELTMKFRKDEYLDEMVEKGVLAYYDVSVTAREEHDRLVAEARAIKDPDLRLRELDKLRSY